MKYSDLGMLCGIALMVVLAMPASCAVTPLWIEPATVGGDLSGVVISADDSTIIAGGDQLISLTPEGQKRWSGWSGTSLAVSSDGDYILTSKDRVVRLISSTGTLIWDRSMEISITEVAMAPDASVIAATGGGRIRTMKFSGEAIESNSTMVINHIAIMPAGDRILITTSKNVQLSNFTLLSEWSDRNTTQNLVAVAADGSAFVTATNNRIRMYNGTGSLLWDTKVAGGNAQALSWSRDRSTIVLGMDDNNLLVLDRNGRQLWSANATNWITSVAVSGDGNTIAAGSLDKKVSVYNHAGTRLGTFTTRTAIGYNSVAVTNDGSLVVFVDDSAVYGLLRSSFIPETTPGAMISGTASQTTGEPTVLPATTTRRITTMPTIPTPYPSPEETPEAALSPAVPLTALGLVLLVFCRAKRP
ncbi:MAG TPA: WD40 repeat domain-containing protein [Methanoregula sp.]|nr:WD40 repeat domain-containing protein [Methanoregula sp.]